MFPESKPYPLEEEFAASYILPDPLEKEDGGRVATPVEWMNSRREKILQLFKDIEYGEELPRPDKLEFKVLAEKKDALNGRAVRREIEIKCAMQNGKSHSFIMLLYIPASAKGKVPVFLGLNFKGNHTTTYEEDVLLTGRSPERIPVCGERGVQTDRWQHKMLMERGYASATVCYQDIYFDRMFSEPYSIFKLFFEPCEYESIWEKYSVIGAWAWGLSRAMDCLENQKEIDRNKVILHGHSRLGKTALWAGALDQRFAMVVSNDSGCGGGCLHKRKIGENLSQHRFYERREGNTACWFIRRTADFINKEELLPVDQHELLALIAPRPLAVGTATEDFYADPKGEFLACKAASEVYELFGSEGFKKEDMLLPDECVYGDISFHYRTGGHDQTGEDFLCYLQQADMFVK